MLNREVSSSGAARQDAFWNSAPNVAERATQIEEENSRPEVVG